MVWISVSVRGVLVLALILFALVTLPFLIVWGIFSLPLPLMILIIAVIIVVWVFRMYKRATGKSEREPAETVS